MGCGSGRNYLPLAEAAPDLWGLDVSPEAIRHLTEQSPAASPRLICGDFRSADLGAGGAFHYCVAIQVFQHGDQADAARYFQRVAGLLLTDGLFFLRVNSASSEVYHRHTVLERHEAGGFTIRYEDGPKAGLLVHFYSGEELRRLTQGLFEVVVPPREVFTRRPAPRWGSWAQWEAVWRRR